MNSSPLRALFGLLWIVRSCFCRFYLSLPGLSRDNMFAIFVLIFPFRTVMAVRCYRYLCYVDIWCYIASYLVCGWFWLVWVAKLYFTGYSIFWSAFPLWCCAIIILVTFQWGPSMLCGAIRILYYVIIWCYTASYLVCGWCLPVWVAKL